jgi:hypothetical protein
MDKKYFIFMGGTAYGILISTFLPPSIISALVVLVLAWLLSYHKVERVFYFCFVNATLVYVLSKMVMGNPTVIELLFIPLYLFILPPTWNPSVPSFVSENTPDPVIEETK